VTLSFLGKQITPNSIEGKEIKCRKGSLDNALNPIASKENMPKKIVESNRTIMAVGRERCNLNKTFSLAGYKIKGKTLNSQHFCEGDSTAVLTERQYSCSDRATVQLF
jgi:hypothetical protein